MVLATIYCLGPVTLFWFAWEWSASLRLSFMAGLTFSLLSPSPMFIPAIRVQLRRESGRRRGSTILSSMAKVRTTRRHPAAVGLLFLHRAMVRRDPRSIAGADRFLRRGCALERFRSRRPRHRRIVYRARSPAWIWYRRESWLWRLAAGFAVSSARADCHHCAQCVDGARKLSCRDRRSYAAEALLVLTFALVWFATRRLNSSFERFVLLFAPWMFLIPIADIDWNVTIVPQANRYLLELDMAACLLFAVLTLAAAPASSRKPGESPLPRLWAF